MTHLADAPAVFRTTDLSAGERYLIEWGYATRLCSDPYSTHDAKYVLARYSVHSVIIVIIIIIIIIIQILMFMVLSSWQSHCESSPGSFDECRTAPSGR